MDFYVIYDHPRDYPDEVVCRWWRPEGAGPIVARGETVEEVREQLPEGLVNIGRFRDDDPAIAEVWI